MAKNRIKCRVQWYLRLRVRVRLFWQKRVLGMSLSQIQACQTSRWIISGPSQHPRSLMTWAIWNTKIMLRRTINQATKISKSASRCSWSAPSQTGKAKSMILSIKCILSTNWGKHNRCPRSLSTLGTTSSQGINLTTQQSSAHRMRVDYSSQQINLWSIIIISTPICWHHP